MTPLDHPELAYSTNGPLANSGAINQIQFVFYDTASDPAEPTDFYISRITVSSAGTVAPEITRQPASKALYAGRPARFGVECLGTSLSYQWRRNGANLVNGANISGAQTDTLVISDVGPGDAASYTVVVTNSAGGVTSSPPATLTLVQPSGAQYESAVLGRGPGPPESAVYLRYRPEVRAGDGARLAGLGGR